MTDIKFKEEIQTLEKFFQLYCNENHIKQKHNTKIIDYKNKTYIVEVKLCDDCNKLIDYSLDRLENCPHKIKPRCRKCENPCYEKYEWKNLAKVMRYSGTKLQLNKIKNFFIKKHKI